MEETLSEETLIMINGLATTQVLLEVMDALKHTSAYEGSTKVATKKLNVQLTQKVYPKIKVMFDNDEELSMQYMVGIEEICKLIARGEPSIIMKLGELLSGGIDLSQIVKGDE